MSALRFYVEHILQNRYQTLTILRNGPTMSCALPVPIHLPSLAPVIGVEVKRYLARLSPTLPQAGGLTPLSYACISYQPLCIPRVTRINRYRQTTPRHTFMPFAHEHKSNSRDLFYLFYTEIAHSPGTLSLLLTYYTYPPKIQWGVRIAHTYM